MSAIEDVFTGKTKDRPYIIAEIGVNHEGSLQTAERLIREANEGGADAVKFQAYKANKIAAADSPAYWDLSEEPTATQFQLFKKYDSFGEKEFSRLAEYSNALGIDFLSTPFDTDSAGYLSPLMPAIKISSSDITNKPFIEQLCSYSKPIILSTGASYLHEIVRAVEWIEQYGNPLALLHCVLSYPTQEEDANLGRISYLRAIFPHLVIGYSDHTRPGDMEVCTTAAILGAQIIEKHFTYDKTLPGNDHYHAMTVDDLRSLRNRLNRRKRIVGEQRNAPLTVEEPARLNARRSLVTAHDLPAGKNLEYEDLTFKRPGTGISPAHIREVVGMKTTKKLQADTVLFWSVLK